MKQSLGIDTIALQVNFTSEASMYLAKYDLKCRLTDYGFFYKEEQDEFQYNYKTIATMHSGSYGTKNDDKKVIVYYISIKLAGLKRYILDIDTASRKCLLIIFSYLNTHDLPIKITQLNIAIDIYTKFENILVLCTKRVPTTNYFKADSAEQPFQTTTYIERFKSAAHKKNATLHTQSYSKSAKNNLEFELTRIETSIQKNFLDTHGLNIGAIYKQLLRYHILYIPNKKRQQEIREQYDSQEVLRKSNIKSLNIEKYRIHPDILSIHSFVSSIFQVNDNLLDHFLSHQYSF